MSPHDERKLLRHLLGAWQEINRLHFGGGLRPPTIELTDAEQSLGLWRPSSRSIALSRSLCSSKPWPYIIDVLKHEMAHQYVDEVLKPDGETAHGPAFRRVCGQLGIPCRASAREHSKTDAIMNRIQRLLRLGESTNEHEAKSALKKAKSLLEKHKVDHLDFEERPDYIVRYFGQPKHRVPAVEKVLAGLLARDFFVAAIWVPGSTSDGKSTKLLEISGRAHHVELAEHVYSYLLNTVEELWKQAKVEHGYRGRTQKRRFALGLLSGFSNREPLQEATSELVVRHERQLQGFITRRHPRLRAGRKTRVVCDEAYAQGKETGRRLTIRPPISTGPPSTASFRKQLRITSFKKQ